MKRQLQGIVGLLGIGILAACSAEVDPEAGIAGAEEEMVVAPGDGDALMQAPEEYVGARQVADDAERIEMSAEGASNISAPPQNLGKTCHAMCTVAKIDPNAWCPATMAGTGRTTFLGGCNKACNKADGDAASKLPPGCVIYQCNHTGC
jgi:hypothetical protein